MIRHLVSSLLLGAIASAAAAQGSGPVTAGPAGEPAATSRAAIKPLPPACAPKLGPVDSLTYMVGARVYAYDPNQHVADDYLELVAQGIRESLHLPHPLALDVYDVGYVVRGPGDTLWAAHADVSGMLALTLERTGRLRHVELLSSTLSPPLDDALVAAVTRADSAQAFPPVPDQVIGDSVHVRVALVTFDERRPIPSQPFFRIHVPIIREVTPARPRPGNRLKMLPDADALAATGGLLEVHVVVSPEGHVVPSALWVEQASDRAWLQAVGDALGDFVYDPAVIRGCAVFARNSQTFRLRSVGAP